MKVYISGKIGDVTDPNNYEQTKVKFDNAQMLLESIDNLDDVVNPMNNGIPKDAPWLHHLIKDLELLDGCDAIFMLKDWRDSDGAVIEHMVAQHDNKTIIEESTITDKQRAIAKLNAENIRVAKVIESAIIEVTGMCLSDYSAKSRNRERFYSRMMFVYHCRKAKMKLTQIAKFVRRDHSTMLHLLNKYGDEVKFNPYFRGLAEKVENILNKTNK